MKTRYKKFNMKRRIAPRDSFPVTSIEYWGRAVHYGGNPEHKKNPGDFGLNPPASPRRGKSLCDTAHVIQRAGALELLREGIKRQLVSVAKVGDWPRNIWAVTDQGTALEAQLENAETGTYHGYPMPDSDPFADEIRSRWANHG